VVKSVWLFVKSAVKRGRSKTESVQFLAPTYTVSPAGLWVITRQVDENKGMHRKTWKDVVFNVTGTGRTKKLTTVVLFPVRALESLEEQCNNHDLEDSSSDEDSDPSYGP
jgi:hypothetical protein